MFNIFGKKKSQLAQLIEQDGIEHASTRMADIISGKIKYQHLAKQFVLEEIEASSQGNQVAIDFAEKSGFSPDEYNGAMQNSSPDIDGADGPQQFLLSLCMQLQPDIDLVVQFRVAVVEKIMKNFKLGKYSGNNLESETILARKEGMRLEEAEVDIMFIVKNDQVIYINGESDHLFTLDKDGDKKLDGRVVNMVFTGQSDNNVIEVFVVFDDSDSYTMFTMGAGRDERLNYVAQAIFKYFVDNKIEGVFSLTQGYASQYLYTFKLYQKGEKYFMVNNGQSQAYLIDEHSIKKGSGDDVKPEFWG